MLDGPKNGGLGVVSAQTTLMLPLKSRAICGFCETPVLLETFVGVEKVRPPSVERLRRISKLPGLMSCQTTLMLPFKSKAICGADDLVSLETFLVENVAPPSLERLKKTSTAAWLRLLSCQTTLMLPLESTAICSSDDDSAKLPLDKF